jgi:5-methylcytosine-specific restriction protein A
MDYFVVEAGPEDIRREKEKARKLRSTRWWKEKLARGTCHYCGGKVAPGELTMEHVVPLVRGGLSRKNNLVTACKDCNSKKKYMLPMEWDQYMKKLRRE